MLKTLLPDRQTIVMVVNKQLLCVQLCVWFVCWWLHTA